MNERILKLAINCATHKDWDNPAVDPTEYTFSPSDVEKFAEFIVRECAGIIESQDVDPGFKLRMSWAVKKHFGVEE